MSAMSQSEVRNAISRKVREVEDMAKELFPRYNPGFPLNIEFFTRGRSAGWASLGKWHVRFNEHIAGQNMDDMLNDTIPHEVAHIVSAYLGYGMNHNMHWKRICRMLGGSGKRTYDPAAIGVTPIRGRQTRQHEYRLPSGNVIWLGTGRHNKIQNYTAAYRYPATNERIASNYYTGETRLKA